MSKKFKVGPVKRKKKYNDIMDDSGCDFTGFLIKGDFVSTCLRCKEPSTASYDCNSEIHEIVFRCVNCGYKQISAPLDKFEFTVIYEG